MKRWLSAKFEDSSSGMLTYPSYYIQIFELGVWIGILERQRTEESGIRSRAIRVLLMTQAREFHKLSWILTSPQVVGCPKVF